MTTFLDNYIKVKKSKIISPLPTVSKEIFVVIKARNMCKIISLLPSKIPVTRENLRQAKCLVIKFLLMEFIVIPKQAIFHLLVNLAKLIFWYNFEFCSGMWITIFPALTYRSYVAIAYWYISVTLLSYITPIQLLKVGGSLTILPL